MRLVTAIALVGVLLPCAAPARHEAPAHSLMPYLTLAGAHSAIKKRTFERLTSAKDFANLYMQHLGQDPTKFDEFYNPHGVPVIDFEHCMVIAVFEGDGWNCAGVYAQSAAEENGSVIFRVNGRGFQTMGPDGGGQRVSPFGIFVIPRSDKAIVLQTDVRGLKDEPAKWQEIARFPVMK